jgi:hypothetical protein
MSQQLHHKRKAELLSKDVQCIQGETGIGLPLFVASKDVEKVILGFSPKTAANLRSQKKGPPYSMVGGTPYYKLDDLVDYFGGNRVETFNSECRT